MIKFSKFKSRALAAAIAASMVLSGISPVGALKVQAADFDGNLKTVQSVTTSNNVATVTFNDNVQAKITFLEDDIFRYNVDPSGDFSEYARTNNATDTAKIPQHPDSSDEYTKPGVSATEENGDWVITAGQAKIKLDKATAKMTVEYNGKVVMEESAALTIRSNATTQSLVKQEGENFFGGGTQNGRFIHTGESINIKNESNWVDGGVASPSPFYWSSKGYGVLRNTFIPGVYDFGKTVGETVKTVHNEQEFDAYYFLSDGEANTTEVAQDILQGYYEVTGNPVLLPEYGFYEGHLNCYNRDSWTNDGNDATGWVIKGSSSNAGNDTEKIASAYEEKGGSQGYRITEGLEPETLNGKNDVRTTALDNWPTGTDGEDEFSARAVIDQYEAYDMPLGYFLPNDGYGCGYGQNGYYKTGGVENGQSTADRIAAVDANVANLKAFTDYANEKGVATGLWTQSNLSPDANANTSWHLLRDFEKEVKTGGITTLKTDVAWVGQGYNFALNGLKNAYDIVTKEVSFRPNIITLDGWAGTQRYGSIWTGDQYGGNWEYIRFHVPTYIGQSLAGNPNIGSDMDGIFGGAKVIATRDTQWKVFTPHMLNMDGWGSFAKTPQTFGDPYTGISRMYLKLKAQLLPYIYTSAASAANIDTGNDDTGLPMIRAMFLEYPEDNYAATKNMQYQFMFGSSFLVAPIYQDTDMKENGDDIRNDIYLPDEDQIWIDYFTGKQYRGGQALNNFDAPIWKLPVFVKNGAIVPMWEENNSPDKINKANRIVEFWPAGESSYTLYEDDGKTANAEVKEVEGYGSVNKVNYGGSVGTTFTSKVEGDTVTLTASKAEVKDGGYEGYNSTKNTTFVVNVSKTPGSIAAKNGNSDLSVSYAQSKAEFDALETVEAGEVIVYYDESPAIEYYGVEEEDEFAEMMKDQKSTPKFYAKFAPTDVNENEQKLILTGFENKDASLEESKLVESLQAPSNVKDVEESKTPTSNTISWDAVDGATGYDVEVDGIINSVGNVTTYVHADQPYHSEHTYRVRTRNAEGYSDWSEVITVFTAEDPYRNVPTPQTITWTGGIYSSEKVEKFFDNDLTTTFHSAGLNLNDQIPLIVDYGTAYQWDKIEYYSRTDFGNGTVYKMDVYASLDGVHWEKVHDGNAAGQWTYQSGADDETNKKVISLDGKASRYLKFIPLSTAGNFFGGRELLIHKKDGTSAFAVGSTNGAIEVSDADYSNLDNYKGESKFNENVFNTQIKSRFGDINMNDYFDVYDYAFTVFKMNGGTEKTGKVAGNLLLIPSKEEVKAGETFSVDVYADNVKNLNAFGHILKYESDKLTYGENGTSQSVYIGQMTNLTIGKIYDQESYINLAFANVGNKETYTGSGVIATITLTAKEDTAVKDAIKLEKMWLIGPGYDFIECNSTIDVAPPQLEEVGAGESELVYNTDFTMTMTNAHLQTDDGTNVQKLIQQNNYNGLFNKTQSRDFEFKWETKDNYELVYPDYIKLPVTISLALDSEQEYINRVSVHNAPGSKNGYMTDATLIFTYEDGESVSVNQTVDVPAGNLVDEPDVFTFFNPKGEEKVTSLDLVINEAVTSSAAAMLTLSELEVYGDVSGNTTSGNTTSGNTASGNTVSGNILWGEKMKQDDFVITMTNEAYPEDTDGNVKVFIQQNNYDGLFDGITGSSATDRDFEFKWDIDTNKVPGTKLPDYITLPVTLHASLSQAKPVSSVSVYNANKGNGFVTQASAVFKYADNSSSEKITVTLTGDKKVGYSEFKFENPKQDKNVTKIEVTIEKAESKDAETLVNLTLDEMKIRQTSAVVPVTGLEISADTEKVLYKGELKDIKAVFTPANVTNPYFTAASSDENVVRIVTLAGENNVPVQKIYGVGTGKATITLTVLETANAATPITASYEVEVLAGVNKTELINWINIASETVKKFYTAETYAALEAALETANEIKDRVEATEAEVKEAKDAIVDAYNALVELPVKRIKDISGFKAEGPNVGDTPDRAIDEDENTYWESPYYGENVGLPRDLTITLDKAYRIDKVEVVKSQANNGRLTEYEVLVSTDGVNYESVGRTITPTAELVSGIRFEKAGVTHIIVRAHAATNSDGTPGANYARIAEVRFYGIDPDGDNTAPVLSGDVTVEAQSETSTRLSFAAAEDPSGILEYKITVTKKGETSPIITIQNTTETSHLLEGLTNGETYVVSIIAVDGADNISEPFVYEFTHKFGSGSEEPSTSDNDTPSTSDNDTAEGLWITGIKEEYSFTNGVIKPEIEVYDGNKLLVEKKDYTLVHKNNKNAYAIAQGEDGFDGAKAPYVEVKMKGNNAGSKKVYYKILPVDLSETQLEADKLTVIAKNSKAQKVTPVLYWMGKKLKLNKDFTVLEGTSFSEGTHKLTLQGKGNYDGTIETEVIISGAKNASGNDVMSMNKVTVKGITKSVAWTEEGAVQNGLSVTYKKNTLAEGEFTVDHTFNEAVGTGFVILTGTGVDTNNDNLVFVGTKTVTFKITGTAMTKKNITVTGLTDQTYTGKAIRPTEEVKEDGTLAVSLKSAAGTMEEGTDYTVSYTKNIEKGTATVTFKGMESGGYTGSLKQTFKIQPASVADLNVTVSGSDFGSVSGSSTDADDKLKVAYTKGTTTPAVTVTTEDGEELKAGKDYAVSYKNNKKAGQTGSVIIKGKGNYASEKTIAFEIVKKELSNENGIQVVAKDKVATGKAGGWKQSVRVLDSNGKVLGSQDYDKKNIVYTLIETADGAVKEKVLGKADIVEAGSVIRVTVTGKGDYAGTDGNTATAEGTYRILDKGYDISKATIKINSQEYTGKAIEITEQKQFTDGKVYLNVAKGQKEVLTLGEDIEVVEGSYVKNVEKGTAKVTFKGMDDSKFGGTKIVTFKITARDTSNLWEVFF